MILSPTLVFVLFYLVGKTTLAANGSVREPVFSLMRVSHCKNKIRIVQYGKTRTDGFIGKRAFGLVR
jgi:hypothetical protein